MLAQGLAASRFCHPALSDKPALSGQIVTCTSSEVLAEDSGNSVKNATTCEAFMLHGKAPHSILLNLLKEESRLEINPS